jgi:hypothetical protein
LAVALVSINAVYANAYIRRKVDCQAWFRSGRMTGNTCVCVGFATQLAKPG